MPLFTRLCPRLALLGLLDSELYEYALSIFAVLFL